jgi:hypothetical protein
LPAVYPRRSVEDRTNTLPDDQVGSKRFVLDGSSANSVTEMGQVLTFSLQSYFWSQSYDTSSLASFENKNNFSYLEKPSSLLQYTVLQ